MNDVPDNQTRTRILDAAEELFSKRGYAAVRLRDIAGAVGMRHASLYYYAPNGKKQLFVEVMERTFHRHRAGMNQAILAAGDDIRTQTHAVAQWLVSQPPLDFFRMLQAGLPAIGEQEAERLMQVAFEAVRLPMVAALERARSAGQVEAPDIDVAALALVSLIQSVHSIPERYRSSSHDRDLARQLADMLLHGWLTR